MTAACYVAFWVILIGAVVAYLEWRVRRIERLLREKR